MAQRVKVLNTELWEPHGRRIAISTTRNHGALGKVFIEGFFGSDTQPGPKVTKTNLVLPWLSWRLQSRE
ncbi:hypothetical protein STEG23_023498, partial [Scotinomys teguina]